MGGKPSSEVDAPTRQTLQHGGLKGGDSLGSKQRLVDALVDSATIDEMLEVAKRRKDTATPMTTSVALRHLTVRSR